MEQTRPMTTQYVRMLWGAVTIAVFSLLNSWNALGCSAADDPQAFVDALCQRHYFDTATEYLQSQATDSHLSTNLKAIIPYQQAIVLSNSADQAADTPSRNADRRRACVKLREFLTANPDHEFAAPARDLLGNALMLLGDTELALSRQSVVAQTAQRTQARADYIEARTVFEELAQQLRSQLDKLSPGDEREELGAKWLGASVNADRSVFFMAMAADPGSRQRTELLKEAAAQCANLYQKYPHRMGGGIAHFYEGRADEELGEQKQAMAAYTDLIDEFSDNDASVRSLKIQVVLRAQHYWLQDQNYDAIIDKTLSWVKSAQGSELQDPDWLSMKLSAATALQKAVAASSKNDVKTTNYLKDARALATDIVNSKNSELQPQAQELLAQLSRTPDSSSPPHRTLPKSAVAASTHEVLQLAADTKAATTQQPQAAADSDADIKSFDQAFDKASEATEDVKSVQVELEFAHQEAVPDAKHIAELEATLKDKRAAAFKYCQLAISLANGATNLEKVNQVRYWLCWFHYANGNYYDAAVLGEFLARKYPKSASALSGAQVALASLDALYRQQKQAGDNDLSFETNHSMDLANYVIGHWPDDVEAATALEMMVSFAIESGDYDKAKSIINKAPADSLSRLGGQAKLGQALWVKYLRTMQQLREQKSAAPGTTTTGSPAAVDSQAKQNLDALLKQAKESLEAGVDGLSKQEGAGDSAVLPALSLAQLYLNAGDADKALSLLEDPKIGPLTLLKKNSAATQDEVIASEIYKTALNAYVAVVPQQLDNAVAMMSALDKLYAHDKDGAARSMQTLVDIAFGLEQKLDDLNSRGDTDKAQSTVKAFEKFLNKISERQATADYKTLNWVAATYESLANGMNSALAANSGNPQPAEMNPTQPVKLSTDAQADMQQAAKAYEAILAKAKDDPNFMPDDKVPAIRRRLALVYRSLGNYDKSIALFAEVLKEKQSLLPLQVEAAYTYQLGGKNQNPDFYVAAILGGRGVADSIWGWNKISQKTARDEHFRDNFHEARYNMALCRVEFAGTRTSADEKKKLLELAKGTIRETKRYESTLGGAKWKSLYEKLLREIQKDLDEPVVGLQEFDQKEAEAAATKDAKN